MRATKKTSKKKHCWKKVFLFPEMFFSQCFFFENRQQFNARAGQKKNTCFFGNARPKSNARAHLKQRKKHSGLSKALDWIKCFLTDLTQKVVLDGAESLP